MRWNPETRALARDEQPTFRYGGLPDLEQPAKNSKPNIYPLLLGKLSEFITRYYFSFPLPKDVLSFVEVFPVAKGTDSRPVFNGAKSKIIDKLWAPNFPLPTGNSMCNTLDYRFKIVDRNFGEFFNNPYFEISMQQNQV